MARVKPTVPQLDGVKEDAWKRSAVAPEANSELFSKEVRFIVKSQHCVDFRFRLSWTSSHLASSRQGRVWVSMVFKQRCDLSGNNKEWSAHSELWQKPRSPGCWWAASRALWCGGGVLSSAGYTAAHPADNHPPDVLNSLIFVQFRSVWCSGNTEFHLYALLLCMNLRRGIDPCDPTNLFLCRDPWMDLEVLFIKTGESEPYDFQKNCSEPLGSYA